jgi:hypothetical protein
MLASSFYMPQETFEHLRALVAAKRPRIEATSPVVIEATSPDEDEVDVEEACSGYCILSAAAEVKRAAASGTGPDDGATGSILGAAA